METKTCFYCHATHRRCERPHPDSPCKQCETKNQKCIDYIPQKRGPKSRKHKGIEKPKKKNIFWETPLTNIVRNAVKASLEEFKGSIYSLTRFDQQVSPRIGQELYHNANIVQHLDFFQKSFHLNNTVKPFELWDRVQRGVADYTDSFVLNSVIALSSQRLGNKSLAFECCNKAYELKHNILSKQKISKEKACVGLGLFGLFCCIEGDGINAIIHTQSGLDIAEDLSLDVHSSLYRVCLYLSVMTTYGKIFKASGNMYISERIIIPKYIPELCTELDRVTISSIGKQSRLSSLEHFAQAAEVLIKDQVTGLEEPLFASVVLHLYMNTIRFAKDSEILLNLLEKTKNLEIYLQKTYKGTDICRASIEYCLRAVRVKIFTMLGTIEACQLAIEEANRCTDISMRPEFAYSACFVTVYTPIVTALHLRVKDLKRAAIDYRVVKEIAKRYSIALPISESLEELVGGIPNPKPPPSALGKIIKHM